MQIFFYSYALFNKLPLENMLWDFYNNFHMSAGE